MLIVVLRFILLINIYFLKLLSDKAPRSGNIRQYIYIYSITIPRDSVVGMSAIYFCSPSSATEFMIVTDRAVATESIVFI